MSDGTIWNLPHRGSVSAAATRAEATRAHSAAERVHEDMLALDARVERLNLACAAMWSLLKQHGHGEEELLAKMQELDLLDGQVDGRLAPPARTCTACRRKSSGRRELCVYCGAKLPPAPAFGADV
ncbi:MAG TPA: hypothetical protein VK824_00220 [Planctomycetota bacterium]|nr:hypothetical protein [Planctomycetota bacterium]